MIQLIFYFDKKKRKPREQKSLREIKKYFV